VESDLGVRVRSGKRHQGQHQGGKEGHVSTALGGGVVRKIVHRAADVEEALPLLLSSPHPMASDDLERFVAHHNAKKEQQDRR
jgi:hypothetical protein